MFHDRCLVKDILINEDRAFETHRERDPVRRAAINEFGMPVFAFDFELGKKSAGLKPVNDKPRNLGAHGADDVHQKVVRQRPRHFNTGNFHFDGGRFHEPDDDRDLALAVFFFKDNDLVLTFLVNDNFGEFDLDHINQQESHVTRSQGHINFFRVTLPAPF